MKDCYVCKYDHNFLYIFIVYLKHSLCIDEHQKNIKDCFVSSGIVEDPEFDIEKNSTKTDQEKHLETCW